MKRSFPKSLALLLSLCPSALFGGAVCDFESQCEVSIAGKDKGGAALLAPAPEPDGKLSLKTSWEGKHAKWLDIVVRPFVEIPETAEKVDGTLSFSVYGDGSGSVSGISPRFVDAKGEIFQWKKVVSLSKGWQELSYDIRETNFSDSWGDKKTGSIQRPLKFQGFAVSFNSESGNPGSLFIDKISFSVAGRLVPFSKHVYKFDDSEKWRKHSKPGNVSATSEGLEVSSWSPEKSGEALIFKERKSEIAGIGSPDSVSMKVLNVSGSPLQASVLLMDAKGVIFLLKARDLKEGSNSVEWDVKREVAAAWGVPGVNAATKMEFPVSVYELRLVAKAPFQNGKAVFKALDATGSMPELDALEVDVETGSPIHILAPGAEKALAFKVLNESTVPVEFELEAKLKDYFGSSLAVSGNLSAKPGESAVLPFQKSLPKRGIWWVDYTLKDKSGKYRRSGTTSFCVMEPACEVQPAKPSPFVFGMNTHTERWCKQDQVLEVMTAKLCGVKAMRVGVEWGGLQPEPDVWNWEPEDNLIDMYSKVGIQVQPLMGFCPKWAAPAEKRESKNWLDWNRVAPENGAWRKYVREFVSRYKGRIKTVEIWNEPDIDFFKGTLEQYLEMMKSAYEEAKAADPDILVMTGGFATLSNHPTSKKDFQKNAVLQGQDWFDIHANHEHGSFENYVRLTDVSLAEIRKQLKSFKPWYPNETALHSMNGEHEQAETLVKKMVFSFARGAIGYNWYDLRNDGWNPKDAEHNYGIVTNDFHPKAGYPAYNNLARLFAGKSFSSQLEMPQGAFAFVFKDAKEGVMSAWGEDRRSPDSILILDKVAEGSKSVDIMGNEEPAKVIEGKTLFRLSSVPSYFVSPVSSLGDVKILGPLACIDSLPVACPGSEAPISGTLFNPFDRDTEFKLKLELPEGVSCSDAVKTVKAPALSKGTFSFMAAISQDFQSSQASGAKLLFEAGSWSGSISIPLAVAQRIPAKPMAERRPDFALNTHSSVFNVSENDPNLAHLAWTGPKDQSCEVRLGREKGAMLVRVDVSDDVHFQEGSGGNVWQGDCIQMAFKVPGQSGYWELGLSMIKDGKPDVFCWSMPQGKADPSSKVVLKVTPSEGKLVYEASLPYEAFGLSDQILEKGVRFNLIVNDNDGKGRKGWIQIAPGIGQGKNPDIFPYVVFGN